jgi:hypothetical protein
MIEQPWDFGTAHERCSRSSRNQESAEEGIREAYKVFALKEEQYRTALATKILQLKADGVAITACGEIARGDKLVAKLRYERDVAEGVREAATQVAWRRNADRKDAQRFADWSQRRELAEGGVS